MPALFKADLIGQDKLGLSSEVRLGLCFITSLASLIASDNYAVGLLLGASMLYVILQVKLKTIAIAYLIFGLMAGVALTCVWGLTFVFEAMKNAKLTTVIIPFARLAIAVNTILPLAIYANMPGLLGTMNRVRLPGIIKLPMLITIRFIPTFLNDLKQIREAIKLRFRTKGRLFWLRHPILWWRVFSMPLVVRLIRSADELAVASELKGLSAKTDFGASKLILAAADKSVIAIGFITIGLSLILQVLHVAG